MRACCRDIRRGLVRIEEVGRLGLGFKGLMDLYIWY